MFDSRLALVEANALVLAVESVEQIFLVSSPYSKRTGEMLGKARERRTHFSQSYEEANMELYRWDGQHPVPS